MNENQRNFRDDRSHLIEILKGKEKDEFVMPADWEWVKNNKSTYFLNMEEDAKYQHETAARCINPCFQVLSTSVTNIQESECMLNCIAKAWEAKALFEYMKIKRDVSSK